ncbi:hypothetical protein PC116_g34596, partial [Phytophthora cactorum]
MMASFRILTLLFVFFNLVLADCECGYSIITPSDDKRYVFTDILESDFVHLDITDTDKAKGYGGFGWTPQEFNMSSVVARGP